MNWARLTNPRCEWA